MKQIKTLANCTEVEFLRQTNKIRHAVERWLTVTDIANIRKRLPDLEKIPADADDETRARIEAKNEQLKKEQVDANFDAILDAMLEEHPEETVEVIRLCCFVEPTDKSKHITYYLGAFSQMMKDSDVVDFFTSLVSLVQTFGLMP